MKNFTILREDGTVYSDQDRFDDAVLDLATLARYNNRGSIVCLDGTVDPEIKSYAELLKREYEYKALMLNSLIEIL